MFKMVSSLLLGLMLILPLESFASGALTPSRYITVDGVSVAVYESKGDKGPGILLIHGNTGSANAFAEILNSSLAKKYRMVALDMIGYGQSGNATSYDVTTFTDAIVAVAQATGVDDGVIVGWSLGGDLALQSASQLPNAKGFFLMGTAPVGAAPGLPPPFLTAEESYAGPAVNYPFIAGLTTAQLNEFVTAFFRPGYSPIPQTFFNDAYRTDPATRTAILNAAIGADPNFQDEVAIVKNLDVPVALIVGDKDFLVRKEYLTGLAPQIPMLWRDKIIVLKNTGHAVQWERSNKIEQLLKDFLRDI